MRHGNSQVVSTGKIPLIRAGKARGISPVGEVLQHGWIEIAVAVKSIHARRKSVLASKEGDACRSVRGRKASTTRIKLSVKPGGNIFLRGELHDAAELSAIFCRIIRSNHAQRFDLVRVERRCKGRRTVLR